MGNIRHFSSWPFAYPFFKRQYDSLINSVTDDGKSESDKCNHYLFFLMYTYKKID